MIGRTPNTARRVFVAFDILFLLPWLARDDVTPPSKKGQPRENSKPGRVRMAAECRVLRGFLGSARHTDRARWATRHKNRVRPIDPAVLTGQVRMLTADRRRSRHFVAEAQPSWFRFLEGGRFPRETANQDVAQAVAFQWLESFKEFPPRQKAASFSVDQIVEKLMPKS